MAPWTLLSEASRSAGSLACGAVARRNLRFDTDEEFALKDRRLRSCTDGGSFKCAPFDYLTKGATKAWRVAVACLACRRDVDKHVPKVFPHVTVFVPEGCQS